MGFSCQNMVYRAVGNIRTTLRNPIFRIFSISLYLTNLQYCDSLQCLEKVINLGISPLFGKNRLEGLIPTYHCNKIRKFSITSWFQSSVGFLGFEKKRRENRHWSLQEPSPADGLRVSQSGFACGLNTISSCSIGFLRSLNSKMTLFSMSDVKTGNFSKS